MSDTKVPVTINIKNFMVGVKFVQDTLRTIGTTRVGVAIDLAVNGQPVAVGNLNKHTTAVNAAAQANRNLADSSKQVSREQRAYGGQYARGLERAGAVGQGTPPHMRPDLNIAAETAEKNRQAKVITASIRRQYQDVIDAYHREGERVAKAVRDANAAEARAIAERQRNRGVTAGEAGAQRGWAAASAESDRRMRVTPAATQFRGVSRAEAQVQRDWNMALAESEKRMRSVGLATQITEGYMAKMFRTIINFGTGYLIISGIGRAFRFLGEATIGYNVILQNTQIGLTNLLEGNSLAAKSLIADLEQFALVTPFEFKELVPFTNRLAAVGFELKEIMPTIKSVGEAAAATGLGVEGMHRIIYALGQIKAAGKLVGTEVRQLTEANIKALEYLGKAYGVTRAKMVKMVKDGLIPAKQAIAAITAGIRQKPSEGGFLGSLEAQSKTLVGSMSNIRDRLFKVFGNATKAQFDNLTVAVNRFATAVASPMFYLQARDRMNRVTDAVTGIGKAIIGFAGLVQRTEPLISGAFVAMALVIRNHPVAAIVTMSGFLADSIRRWDETSFAIKGLSIVLFALAGAYALVQANAARAALVSGFSGAAAVAAATTGRDVTGLALAGQAAAATISRVKIAVAGAQASFVAFRASLAATVGLLLSVRSFADLSAMFRMMGASALTAAAGINVLSVTVLPALALAIGVAALAWSAYKTRQLEMEIANHNLVISMEAVKKTFVVLGAAVRNSPADIKWVDELKARVVDAGDNIGKLQRLMGTLQGADVQRRIKLAIEMSPTSGTEAEAQVKDMVNRIQTHIDNLQIKADLEVNPYGWNQLWENFRLAVEGEHNIGLAFIRLEGHLLHFIFDTAIPGFVSWINNGLKASIDWVNNLITEMRILIGLQERQAQIPPQQTPWQALEATTPLLREPLLAPKTTAVARLTQQAKAGVNAIERINKMGMADLKKQRDEWDKQCLKDGAFFEKKKLAQARRALNLRIDELQRIERAKMPSFDPNKDILAGKDDKTKDKADKAAAEAKRKATEEARRQAELARKIAQDTAESMQDAVKSQIDALQRAAQAWEHYGDVIDKVADRAVDRITSFRDRIADAVQSIEEKLLGLGRPMGPFYDLAAKLKTLFKDDSILGFIYDESRARSGAARLVGKVYGARGEVLGAQQISTEGGTVVTRNRMVAAGSGAGAVTGAVGQVPAYIQWMLQRSGKYIGLECGYALSRSLNQSGIFGPGRKGTVTGLDTRANMVFPDARGNYPEGTIFRVRPTYNPRTGRTSYKRGHYEALHYETDGPKIVEANYRPGTVTTNRAFTQFEVKAATWGGRVHAYMPPGVPRVYPGGGAYQSLPPGGVGGAPVGVDAAGPPYKRTWATVFGGPWDKKWNPNGGAAMSGMAGIPGGLRTDDPATMGVAINMKLMQSVAGIKMTKEQWAAAAIEVVNVTTGIRQFFRVIDLGTLKAKALLDLSIGAVKAVGGVVYKGKEGPEAKGLGVVQWLVHPGQGKGLPTRYGGAGTAGRVGAPIQLGAAPQMPPGIAALEAAMDRPEFQSTFVKYKRANLQDLMNLSMGEGTEQQRKMLQYFAEGETVHGMHATAAKKQEVEAAQLGKRFKYDKAAAIDWVKSIRAEMLAMAEYADAENAAAEADTKAFEAQGKRNEHAKKMMDTVRDTSALTAIETQLMNDQGITLLEVSEQLKQAEDYQNEYNQSINDFYTPADARRNAEYVRDQNAINRETQRGNRLRRDQIEFNQDIDASIASSEELAAIYRTYTAGSQALEEQIYYLQTWTKEVQEGQDAGRAWLDIIERINKQMTDFRGKRGADIVKEQGESILEQTQALRADEVTLAQQLLEIEGQLTDAARLQAQLDEDNLRRRERGVVVTQEELDLQKKRVAVAGQIERTEYTRRMAEFADQRAALGYGAGLDRDAATERMGWKRSGKYTAAEMDKMEAEFRALSKMGAYDQWQQDTSERFGAFKLPPGIEREFGEMKRQWQRDGFKPEEIDEMLQTERMLHDIELLDQAMQDFTQSMTGVFEDAFGKIYDEGFGTFFDNIAKGTADLLNQMTSQILASWAMSQLMSLIPGMVPFFGGIGAGGAAMRGGLGTPPFMPSGGLSGLSSFGGHELTHMATGGPVLAGMPYLVGEHGRELFVPRQNGHIVSSGGSGGGGDIIINVYGVKDAENVPGAIRRQLGRSAGEVRKRLAAESAAGERML